MATERKKRKIRLFKFNKSKPEKQKSKEAKSKERPVQKHTEDENDSVGSKLKVINGTRKRNKIIRFIVYGVILSIIVALLIINYLTPTGIVEALQNKYSAMGDGAYPVSVYSANAKSYNCRNGIQTVINNSFFEIYNSKGKLMQAASHGMSNPQLEVSEARFLLYDHDRYTAVVYNYSDKLYTVETDSAITAADIGRDGTFAIATDSDSYQSTVLVYNKNNESVYKWNSANYYVTDVAVADDGESIAVSLLNLVGGRLESYVYILRFDSAEPLYRYTFSDAVTSLTSCGEIGLLANGIDRAYNLKWDGSNQLDLGVSGVIRCYDYEMNSASCIVFGREDNEQINTVKVLSAEGSVLSTFEFNTTVNDVCVSETLIAVLTDNEVYVYNHSGALLNTYASSVKGEFVGLGADGEIFVLDSSKLIKLVQ